MPRLLRSPLAILAGVAVWPAIALPATQAVAAGFRDRLREDLTTDDPTVLVLFLALSVVASLAAGYVTAWVARRQILAHSLVLGAIQLTIGTFVQAASWDRLPLWYNLVFLALVIPGNVAGAMLHRPRPAERPALT